MAAASSATVTVWLCSASASARVTVAKGSTVAVSVMVCAVAAMPPSTGAELVTTVQADAAVGKAPFPSEAVTTARTRLPLSAAVRV